MMTNKSKTLNYIAIIAMFTTAAGGTLENSAIQSFIEAWPNISTATIRLMITLPSLVSMFVMMFIGKIVGTKASYRLVTIAGFGCMLIGGVVPFFIHSSWFIVLAFRTLLGVGVGFFSVRNPLLMRSVPATDLARFIGLGGMAGSLCSVVMNPLVGRLTTLGWQYAFLSNLMVLVPGLLAFFFLKEPEATIEVQEVSTQEKFPFPKQVYFYIIIQFLATMSLYPMLSGISTYLTEIDIASPTVAGYMLSIYTGGSLLANLFLPKTKKIFNRNLLFVATILPMLGCLGVVYFSNIGLIAFSILISGLGFGTFAQTLQLYVGNICDAKNVAQASLWILAVNQLGVFLSSYFIEWTAHWPFFKMEMQNTYFACTLIYFMILAVSYLLRKKVIAKII